MSPFGLASRAVRDSFSRRNPGFDCFQIIRGNLPSLVTAITERETLTFSPKQEGGERFYVFEGMAVLDRFLAGIALPKADGGPNGIRTRVSALRGPCPRPLDDGAG